MHHLTLLAFITIGLIGTGFVLMYNPDYRKHHWARAEAYLELHRREKEGRPLIDPNLVDPSTVELPSDEELGDYEIIV